MGMYMRYLRSCFCLLIMIFGFSPLAYSAENVVKVESIRPVTVDNPLYKDGSGAGTFSMSPYALTDGSDEIYDAEQIDSLGIMMRAYMVERTESFTTTYVTEEKVADVKALTQALMDSAVAHTGNPKEGDYLKWQYRSYRYGGSVSGYQQIDENGDKVYDNQGNPVIASYHYNLEWTFTYYTDESEEAEVDEMVAGVLDGLFGQSVEVDPEAEVRKIYDYICDNVEYDHNNKNNNAFTYKYTAYAALKFGRAVCQGYANLMYRLCLERGIDCRLIPGIGNGEAHGWNIVKIGNLYYDCDSTWDAGKSKYQYYLCKESAFPGHERYEDYSSKDFYDAYPMDCDHSYALDRTSISPGCDTEGFGIESCTYCKDERDTVIEPAGHKEGEIHRENFVAATKDKQGSYEEVIYCERCGKELSRSLIYTDKLPPNYKITFSGDGGSGSMKDLTCVLYEEQKLPANGFKKTGYSFGGWKVYRESDDSWLANNLTGGSGWYSKKVIESRGYSFYIFADEDTVLNLSYVDGEVLTFNATWEANQYIGHFESSYGSGFMEDVVLTYGKSFSLTKNAFKRSGYSFNYWTASRASDGKFYAIKSDGKTGWYSEDVIKDREYLYYDFADGESVKNLSGKAGDVITFHAKWKANTYKVYYRTSYGSGSMNSQTLTYGKTKTLRKNAFVRNGYSFQGWKFKRASDDKYYAKKADGSKGWYSKSVIADKGYSYVILSDQESVKNLTSTNGEKLYLYATWKANSYKVYYKANGGSGSMSSQTMTYNSSKTLRKNSFKRSGYSFKGWKVYRKSDDKYLTTKGWYSKATIEKKGYSYKLYDNQASVKNLSTVKGDKVYLYAMWKKK